jgi:hypothetical protein
MYVVLLSCALPVLAEIFLGYDPEPDTHPDGSGVRICIKKR